VEFLTAIFILILVGIVSDTIVKTAKARAKSKLQPELDQLKLQAQEQATLLTDMQAALGEQADQIEELHERLEFTERVLLQVRNRPELPGHDDSAAQPGS
jgi:hypothetical protein